MKTAFSAIDIFSRPINVFPEFQEWKNLTVLFYKSFVAETVDFIPGFVSNTFFLDKF